MEQRRGHSSCHEDEGVITFFFSNFPNGVGEVDMFKVFQKWARVKDVFISRRLNKWGRRFGFVRFFGMRDVGHLERELDQLYVGNKKLFVNIPKYRRNMEEQSRTEGRLRRAPYRARQNEDSHAHKKVTVTGGEQRREDIWVEKKGNRSYAEVATGTTTNQWKGVSFKKQQCVLPWMDRSAVGKLRGGKNVEQLVEELVTGGINMLRVRALGDNLVLLTPREGEKMENFIKVNSEWVDCVFESIKPWSLSSGPSHKSIWVRCYGLSLPLWNEECFTKLIGALAPSAMLIGIDSSTESWENLEFARLQVRILKCESARMEECVRINNQLCNILIEEESPGWYGGRGKNVISSSTSSENVSSS